MQREINLNLIEPILKTSDIKFAGIFGSVARDEARNNSDVDILIRLGKPLSLLELIRLERMISEKLGRNVDLITEDSLSPFIKEEVLHDLKPIYEKG